MTHVAARRNCQQHGSYVRLTNFHILFALPSGNSSRKVGR